MFDPSVPTRCECGNPECTGRILEAQRARTVPDPTSGEVYVHPEDVMECLSAVINHVLATNGPLAAVGLPMTMAVGQYVADWMGDAERHVPAWYVFSATSPAGDADTAAGAAESTGSPDGTELRPLVAELERGESTRLDEALARILDEG